MMITVIIVDDEPLARRKVRRLLARHRDVEIVAECASGRAAVEAIREHGPDVVFLDVQMPELDGFGVLAELAQRRPPVVVFVTAFEQHAVRAFEVHALDYLLKPFDRARLEAALERAREHLGATEAEREARAARLQSVLSAVEQRARAQHLVVRVGSGVELVRTVDIDRLEARGNYVEVHAGERVLTMRTTLSSLERQLEPSCFVRIHRSHIVNVNRIRRLDPLFHGDMTVTLTGGTEVTLTRTYRERLRALWPQL